MFNKIVSAESHDISYAYILPSFVKRALRLYGKGFGLMAETSKGIRLFFAGMKSVQRFSLIKLRSRIVFMEREQELIRELIREEKSRRIFAGVFDRQAIETVHSLASKGYFETLEFVISTGKEAHVFRAVDAAGSFRAVKIYKIETSDFKRMHDYIEGDRRFGHVKKTKREMVFVWAKKEFGNLEAMRNAGIRVPLPVAVRNNALVMEFIGKNGIAAKTVKEQPPENIKDFHSTIVDFLAKMLFKAKIVHADLSEYNVLNNSEEFVVIDVGQGIPLSHPRAKTFFERDLTNISNYLAKKGEKTDSSSLLAEIKAKKSELQK